MAAWEDELARLKAVEARSRPSAIQLEIDQQMNTMREEAIRKAVTALIQFDNGRGQAARELLGRLYPGPLGNRNGVLITHEPYFDYMFTSAGFCTVHNKTDKSADSTRNHQRVVEAYYRYIYQTMPRTRAAPLGHMREIVAKVTGIVAYIEQELDAIVRRSR